MLRSLYSGISGLRNHQLKMDVTSHNIANVNTYGYKAQRITFKEGFSQMLKGATRPAGNASGTNPMQVGLGMAVGSIDSIMEQGALQSTGQLTDLAIEGRGFFAFSNGAGGMFYGRNGALQLSAEGYLVSPSTGYHLVGLTCDSQGNIPPMAVPGGIKIPFGEKSPAKATEEVQFQCNLDADSIGQGTWSHTSSFLTHGQGTDLLIGLFDGNGNSLNIKETDKIDISFKIPGATPEEYSFSYVVSSKNNPSTIPAGNNIWTLEHLRAAIQTSLNDASTPLSGATVSIQPNGQLRIGGVNHAANLTNLVINNATRPTSNSFVASLFSWPGSVYEDLTPLPPPASGPTHVSDSSGTVLAAPKETTPLALVLNSKGRPLGLENGDPININAVIGTTALGDSTTGRLIYWNGVTGDPDNPWEPTTGILPPSLDYTGGGIGNYGATTMKDLMDYIQIRLRLPEEVPNSSGATSAAVEINQANDGATLFGGDTRAPIGSIIIRGMPGKAFEITGLSITAENYDMDGTIPTFFSANMSTTDFQDARDTGFKSTSIEVFDETGTPHTMTMSFTHSGIPGKWLWEVTMRGAEIITGGDRGYVTFSADGSPAAWVFNDGSSDFRFNPNNGSAMVTIRLDVGRNRVFSGITQFKSETTTQAKGQDGYPMGKLSEIAITEKGEIEGIFSNGQTRNLAQILIAEFINPAGLYRSGNSLWAESNNSGEGVLHTPGEGTESTIKPGALEMSNVDLAGEFTDLITTQRGYQANARIITTSDSLLQELVQLVR